ncbi:MAG: cytochrome C oxidase subunit IV family protein [Candidatus Rokubacteria bacterium]|nr:cytochrome C oxidase subunit IV family protein [Candidatus Rokubacteria bacterium]MBI3825175.1 cytochrome C oxidase subunit IV family protein [Candidatus Rokubacteria bacterium]
MAGSEHKHPNYMAIFWYLAVLTVLEIGVVFLPHYVPGIGKMTVGVLLCGFAIAKAALVAMYFMHLKFEARTLGLVALTPLAIATLLVFILLPDGFAVAHKTQRDAGAVTAPAPAKH